MAINIPQLVNDTVAVHAALATLRAHFEHEPNFYYTQLKKIDDCKREINALQLETCHEGRNEK
jgi:hypothetical protein